MKRVPLAWEMVFSLLAIVAAVPIWIVEHPPIQDLPQHLAAIRVIHDFADPELGFSKFFELELGRTQYLTYYLAAHLLAYPLGVFTANKILFTAAIVALPFSMRALLAALGRDERMALFVLPLAWNSHIVLGFLNFAAALPMLLFGLALAVRLRVEWSRRALVGLALVALLTFYTHIVPFGFLALGSVLVGYSGDRKLMLRRLSPLAPALVAFLIWTRTSPAAQAVIAGLARPEFHYGLADMPHWLFDVLRGRSDEIVMAVWAGLLLASLLLGFERARERPAPTLESSLVKRLALLGPLALVAYFVAPSSVDWIWPINGRFPVIAVLFFLIVVPAPRPRFELPIFVAVALVSLFFFREVMTSFRRYAREELGDINAAIAAIPPGQKVAGLIWQRESEFVKRAPFLHAVALYQAKRGGAVMFTFAVHPHSPVRFKPGAAPPPVQNRWEWQALSVRPVPDLDWYDWVLTRGDPGTLESYAEAFELVHDGRAWRVWKRKSDRSAAVEGALYVQRLLLEAIPLTPAPTSACADLGDEFEGKSLQDIVTSLTARATARRGRCSAETELGRDCELELENHANEDSEFFFRLRFRIRIRTFTIAADSLECALAG